MDSSTPSDAAAPAAGAVSASASNGANGRIAFKCNRNRLVPLLGVALALFIAVSSSSSIRRQVLDLSYDGKVGSSTPRASNWRDLYSNVASPSNAQESRPLRLAIANFVDGGDQIYGPYSLKTQMAKFNMTNKATQIVVIPSDIQPKLRAALEQWLGKDNVRTVDKNYIYDRIVDKTIWYATFNKLWVHNLTEFDRIIVLDSDVFVRQNILHWFDYPTPCGIQAKDDLAWNSGAMVITPNTGEFDDMVRVLPNMTRYDPNKGADRDTWIGGYSDQDFLAAYYSSRPDSTKRRCVMPTEAAALSSSFTTGQFHYYLSFRPHIFETVHFTTDKPWRGGTTPNNKFVCGFLREWNESMVGVEEYIEPIKQDYLQNCPNVTTLTSRL